MKSRFFRPNALITWIFTGSLLLSGCAEYNGILKPEKTEKAPYFLEQQPRSCVSKVGVKGRFSAYIKNKGQEEALHGGFEWEQQPDMITIRFLSPLGQVVATADIMPQITTLTIPGKPPRTAKNAEKLIESQLGWTLPVSGLKDWLQGCATDSQNQAFIASPDKRWVVTNDKWQIEYATWIDGPIMPLPKRINLIKGKDLTDLDINIKLVIDQWQF